MGFDWMDKPSSKEFFDELVGRAMRGEASKFEFIRDLTTFRTARAYKRGVGKIARLFGKLAEGLVRQCAALVREGAQDVDALLAAKRFEICRDHYAAEAAVAKDMLSEFKAYLRSGHVIRTLLGGYRPDEECVDYRTLPFRLF